MRTKTSSLIAAATAVLTVALTACSTTTEPAPNATLRPEDRASARAAAGLPVEPDAKSRQSYIDALNGIDPRIIKAGKEDQAVSRGLNQCSSIKTTKDKSKLAESALERFTITTRLPDIATPETGEKIVAAVHTYLCPEF
ncbi:hypothetical protein [Nocardia sp. NPDC051981]|uniref:hypothetical protein n=1 Tax=Nocardia sp. NPDC051981 TaxID=3155417 RepID=UPI0034301982